jgi:hypothetical protein
MDAFSRRSTMSFSARSCTRAQISETEGESALGLVMTDGWDMQQRYAAGVEASELQSSHQLAGHDLIKRSDISPIERINTNPLVCITTPAAFDQLSD